MIYTRDRTLARASDHRLSAIGDSRVARGALLLLPGLHARPHFFLQFASFFRFTVAENRGN
jgi:hypothetical protein